LAINYLVLRTSDNYLYINILLARLKEEGFDCHLRDENTVTIDPLLSPAIGGIKLMVREEDIARANAALDQIESEYIATVRCPSCGKHTLQRLTKINTSKGFLSALWSQLTMGSTQSEEKFYKCTYCGYTATDIP
jgi:predicted RNA-binding Zn-ribbon protein involved in translation (DUF1610 family)